MPAPSRLPFAIEAAASAPPPPPSAGIAVEPRKGTDTASLYVWAGQPEKASMPEIVSSGYRICGLFNRRNVVVILFT